MKGILLLASLFFLICATLGDSGNDDLSLLEKRLRSKMAANKENLNFENFEDLSKSERNHQIVKDFESAYEKYSKDESFEDEWQDKVVDAWDWLVGGFKSIAGNVKTFANQILQS